MKKKVAYQLGNLKQTMVGKVLEKFKNKCGLEEMFPKGDTLRQKETDGWRQGGTKSSGRGKLCFLGPVRISSSIRKSTVSVMNSLWTHYRNLKQNNKMMM